MLRNPLVQSICVMSLFLLVTTSAQAQSCGTAGCSTCSTGSCGSSTTIGANTVAGLGPLANWFGFGLAKKYCCGPRHGCPGYVHCQPMAPRMHFPQVCGKAVCEPCTLEHFGYYNTCWAPWGFPPDFSHCPTPQLAAIVPTSYPKTQYFSPDYRAQQPDAGEELPMKEMTPSMMEKEKMEKEKMEKESMRFQQPGQFQPAGLGPIRTQPVSTAPALGVPMRSTMTTIQGGSSGRFEVLPQPRPIYGSPSPFIPR